VLDTDATVSLLVQRPRETALLVDFDGSLSRIVDHPDDARPLPSAVSVLRDLTGLLGRVAVVSGRPVDFLAAHLRVPGLLLVGGYGIASLTDGARWTDPRATPYLPALEAAARDAEQQLPGILVERKGGLGVTLHWRMAAERAAEVQDVAAELASRYGLEAPQRGRKSVELRPPVPVDKGTAVDQLIEGYRVGAFAGDDIGDVAAFDSLARAVRDGRLEHSVRIGVLSPEAPPQLSGAVDTVVEGPDGLVALLEAVATAAHA
jgi:trehalose 6-phosphate phosphatase